VNCEKSGIDLIIQNTSVLCLNMAITGKQIDMRTLRFSTSFRLLRAIRNSLLAAGSIACFVPLTASAQQPVIVQPGAPGQPTRSLPANTRASLPPVAKSDVSFMQGMIMHHAQAVEMTALIEGRTANTELRLLGQRISHTQGEEMKFMERWLMARGQKTTMDMDKMEGMDHSKMDHSQHNMPAKPAVGRDTQVAEMLMPGMLTPVQMSMLKNAKGKEFDRLFLAGMIQHHQGALTMVKDLFDTPGGGQEADLFNFATDVDSGQRAEIRIMQEMLTRL
jgi:uncharacterized protein (DUF305 family)